MRRQKDLLNVAAKQSLAWSDCNSHKKIQAPFPPRLCRDCVKHQLTLAFGIKCLEILQPMPRRYLRPALTISLYLTD